MLPSLTRWSKERFEPFVASKKSADMRWKSPIRAR